MEFSRPEYWSGLPFSTPGDLPSPGIKPRSPALKVDSLPAEPQGKPKNTGVGSLSFLQWIFPTQESNWDLLYCMWILYQLSYEGMQPNSLFLPGECHGQRGLVSYSPWGHEESDMTEQLTLSPLLSHRLIMLRLIIDNGRCIYI